MSSKKFGINGLYAITPDLLDTADLLQRVRAALEGGVRLLQYRNKTASAELRLEQAYSLRQLTRNFNATLIINDDVRLCLRTAADGVHLGRDDGGASKAREVLGAEKIIGISCYNSLFDARLAVADGADYVAFGAFYPSAVKPSAVVAEIALLHAARTELHVPLVAIGGITASNAVPLVKAGADSVAVISALFDAPDVKAAAQDFSQLFTRNAAS